MNNFYIKYALFHAIFSITNHFLPGRLPHNRTVFLLEPNTCRNKIINRLIPTSSLFYTLRAWRRTERVPPKWHYSRTRINGFKAQETAIWIISEVITSEYLLYYLLHAFLHGPSTAWFSFPQETWKIASLNFRRRKDVHTWSTSTAKPLIWNNMKITHDRTQLRWRYRQEKPWNIL
jgi:hypothetical protein